MTTGEADYSRSVANLKRIVDAPNDDDDVGSACGGALLERRGRNLMTSREPSLSTSWTGDRLEVTAHELLSRVMGVASRSRRALPLPEVTIAAK